MDLTNKKLPGIEIPKFVAIPFGVFDKVVQDEKNKVITQTIVTDIPTLRRVGDVLLYYYESCEMFVSCQVAPMSNQNNFFN